MKGILENNNRYNFLTVIELTLTEIMGSLLSIGDSHTDIAACFVCTKVEERERGEREAPEGSEKETHSTSANTERGREREARSQQLWLLLYHCQPPSLPRFHLLFLLRRRQKRNTTALLFPPPPSPPPGFPFLSPSFFLHLLFYFAFPFYFPVGENRSVSDSSNPSRGGHKSGCSFLLFFRHDTRQYST